MNSEEKIGPLKKGTLDCGKKLYRIQDANYSNPIFFGKNCAWRFDDPEKRFGVCYFSESPRGAFVETIARKKLEGAPIPTKLLKENKLYSFELIRPLTTVEFHGPHLLAMGANASVTAGLDYSISQSWAGAFHAHPDQVDGIRYMACHDNSQFSLAIFERAGSPVPWVEIDEFTIFDDASFLAEMIELYSLDLI